MNRKFEELQELIRAMDGVLVAYSGGVDSAFLALVAHKVLGHRSLAAIADSPSLPRAELQDALDLGNQFSFPIKVVQTQEFQNQNYLANPQNRCYFCKFELFSVLVPLARTENFSHIIYGENASDVGDFRPGSKAAAEFSIRAPLKEVGLTKQEIRNLSTELGLPTADKPQMACLSSRIPYGEAVTPEKLAMIEKAEAFLRERGFYDVRVRHHELKQGALARIEVGSTELARLLEDALGIEITAALKGFGYSQVTLDLQGYRRGALNESIKLTQTV